MFFESMNFCATYKMYVEEITNLFLQAENKKNTKTLNVDFMLAKQNLVGACISA
jgi:hypothetical protein